MSELPTVTVRTRAADYNLAAQAVWIGPDLLVYIWGGEAPHIGAVAMGQSRPSLADPDKLSATASVFAYVGHKEDQLAKETAEALSAALDCKVVVTAGIHWDHLDRAAIDMVVANSRDLVGMLIEELRQ